MLWGVRSVLRLWTSYICRIQHKTNCPSVKLFILGQQWPCNLDFWHTKPKEFLSLYWGHTNLDTHIAKDVIIIPDLMAISWSNVCIIYEYNEYFALFFGVLQLLHDISCNISAKRSWPILPLFLPYILCQLTVCDSELERSFSIMSFKWFLIKLGWKALKSV